MQDFFKIIDVDISNARVLSCARALYKERKRGLQDSANDLEQSGNHMLCCYVSDFNL